MDLFAHALTEGLVHDLMLLHPILSTKCRAHDDRFEMLAIAGDLHMIAGQRLHDVRLNLFWGKQVRTTRKIKKTIWSAEGRSKI